MPKGDFTTDWPFPHAKIKSITQAYISWLTMKLNYYVTCEKLTKKLIRHLLTMSTGDGFDFRFPHWSSRLHSIILP